MAKALLQVFTLLLVLIQAGTVLAVNPLALADGTEFNFEIHPATGNKLFIWIPSEAGPQENDIKLAKDLANQGIEVWRVDLVEARFLPVAQSSMDSIPASDVAAIVNYAIASTNKQIFISATGRAAIPVLRGLQQWQQTYSEQTRLGGVILISPMLFIETPDPGEQAKLMPVVSKTNLPLYILQPKLSPWFWKLATTKPALEQSGSDIFLQTISGVRDRFYFRPDATDHEKQQSNELATRLYHASRLLAALAKKNRHGFKHDVEAPEVRIGKKDRELQTFKGDSTPPELKLLDLDGKALDLREYKGKVVLVNFWASWCPPCVHEMPSMQRLQDKYRNKGFIILGVNMAEDRQTIKKFLNTKVKVDFPILLDNDGMALKRWQVFAFPTSYVIDRKGQIRYALFGGLEWDTPEIMQKIEALLREK